MSTSALAFGLTVLVMVYAVGHISGGHFNPAVMFGAAIAGPIEWKAVPAYMITQVIGASVAALALFTIASGKDGFDAVTSGFASNGSVIDPPMDTTSSRPCWPKLYSPQYSSTSFLAPPTSVRPKDSRACPSV